MPWDEKTNKSDEKTRKCEFFGTAACMADEDDNHRRHNRKKNFKDLLITVKTFLLPCACFFTATLKLSISSAPLPLLHRSSFLRAKQQKQTFSLWLPFESNWIIWFLSVLFIGRCVVFVFIESQMENSIKTCTTHHGTQLFDKQL